MTKPRFYKVEAIVLRASPLGEADRLLTLFTPTMGKLKAVARGVRKPTSKLGGHLDPLTRSSLTLVRGQTLDIVSGADMLESFATVKSNLPRLSRAIYLSEVVDDLNPLEYPNPGAYGLFLEGLRVLATEADGELVRRYMELQFMNHAGFSLELLQCVECHCRIVPKEHAFSSGAGGVLCPACSQSYSDARPISLEALKVLRFFSTATLPSAVGVRIKPLLHQELAEIMDSYVRYTLERELRSAAFVRSVTHPRLSGAADLPVARR